MRQVGFLVVVLGCAHNVAQDKATGPDGKQKGATPIGKVKLPTDVVNRNLTVRLTPPP